MKLFICKILLLAAAARAFGSEPPPILWNDDRLAAVLPIDQALAPVFTDGKIELTLPSAKARPGERYLDAVFQISEQISTDGLLWQAEVFSAAGAKPLAVSTHPVTGRKASLQFDARSAGSGLLQIQILQKGKPIASVQQTFQSDKETSFAEEKFAEVHLDRTLAGKPSQPSWVTFGVPFSAGTLWDASRLSLTDETGKAVPAQFRSTMLWAKEGSQKWVQVDALVGDTEKLQVRFQPQPQAAASPLKVQKNGNSLRVETGVATYVVEPSGALLNQIAANGQVVSEQLEKSRGLYVVDQKGRLGTVLPADTIIETESVGELVARIKVSGIYRTESKEELARFSAWFEFAAHRPECRITHHFILTRNSNEVWFRDIGWDFDLQGWKAEKGLFATKRMNREGAREVELGNQTVTMAQVSHRRYGGGSDRVRLGTKEKSETSESEMGDWGAALSPTKGLLIACQESARQHPKAFTVSPTQLGLDLFHPDTTEELDFRSPALVKRWNEGKLLSTDLAESTSLLPTNAVGWSKTHFLQICPAASPAVAQTLLDAGNAFTFPLLACPAPAWTYQTRVLGALYPQDKERFPAVESFIDRSFDYWAGEQDFFGEYGFVDFFAGPHHTRQFPQSQGRYRASYTLRNAFWLLYLRSGEAKFRNMAVASNRTYLDSYLAGWDGPSRQRGLYIHSVGEKDPYAGLPFYWEGFTRPGMGTHTNLDQFLLDYLVTGNPRAKDGVLAYIDGVKKWWSKNQNDWRILAVLRAVNRAYSLTWDPELRLMQEEILSRIYDPKSPVYLAYKGRPYESSTYKTQEDLSALIEGWELYGTTRYWNIATSLSRFWWQSLTPGGRFEEGRSGEFLWSISGNVSYPQRLWLLARQEATLAPESSSAEAEFRFQGMPYALSAIAASGADKKPVASWVGLEVLTGRAGAIVSKKDQPSTIEAYLQFERAGLQDIPEIVTMGNVSKIGQRLLGLKAGYDDGMLLTIPPETEATDLFIPIPETGIHHAFLNGRTPLLLYADGWWKPSPESLDPPADIYFKLPAGSQNASIQFEKDTILTAPDGTIWPFGKSVRGEVSLPGNLPGLWHFSSPRGGAVRVKNIPPLFSFEISDFLSVPTPGIPAATVSSQTEQPGVSVAPGKKLSLPAPQPDLPYQQGTIEFFYQPAWDSLGLKDPTKKILFQLQTDAKPWSLVYVADSGRAGWSGQPWSKAHVLEMEINTIGQRTKDALCIRRMIVEKDQWVHVAIVWGERVFGYTADRAVPAFDIKIFVDGKEGKHLAWPRQGNHAASAPKSLSFGPNFDGKISHLRISGNQRYTHDFASPAPAQIEKDKETLFFFPLTQDLHGLNSLGEKIELISQ